MDEQINILIQYLLFLDNRFIVAFAHYVLNTYNGLSTISYKSDLNLKFDYLEIRYLP